VLTVLEILAPNLLSPYQLQSAEDILWGYCYVEEEAHD